MAPDPWHLRGVRRAHRVLFALSLLGCGARTDLATDVEDAGPEASIAECLRDADCDDGIACTRDACAGRRCVATPMDATCDDGLFCTGVERCDVEVGCVSAGSPCDDGVACTEDLCDEELACVFEPRRERCPLSHRCDAERGCVARALVHTTTELLEVDLPGGEVRVLAPAEVALTDIALHPDGRTFGITSRSLFSIDESDGAARWIAELPEMHVALDVHPDGSLVAAGRRTVSRIDPDTGAVSPLARFPAGWSSSGDIAFVRGRMLVTGTVAPGTSSADDVLFEVPADGGPLIRVGGVGIPCVWALAPFGDTLYGFTCEGRLIRIDPDTGAGRELDDLGRYRFGGAAAR